MRAIGMNRLKALYEQKGKAVSAYRELLERIEKEGRAPTAEENAQLDKIEQEIQACDADISAEKAAADRRQRADQYAASLAAPIEPLHLQRVGDDGANTQRDTRTAIERFRDYTQAQGMSRAEAIQRIAAEKDDLAKARDAAMRQYLMHGYIEPHLRERAALRMDDDSSGGFLVIPEQFIARLIQDLDKAVMMRGLATIIPVGNAESIGVPSLETDMSDTNWTTELAIGTLDTSLAFAKRRLTPHVLAKPIKVSKDLLRSAALSVEGIVRERMVYKFGTVQETAFMTGSGANQPLGVFTASNAGIGTGQDESTGNTDSAITADGLINAKYKLESQWLNRANLRWIFHRDAVKMIRKLKDGDGQYLWQPGLRDDMNDTLLGVPVLMSEFAPNTFTSALYVGIIGDFSYYWIAEAMQMEVQRLVELYAATNQDGFHGRMKLDGMPVLDKAFVRVKLA